MKLTLIRGLPGSGKSTLAQKQKAIHLEADMFFMKQGQYCYDAAFIKTAHQWCERRTAKLLQHGHSVVVSNTFIQWWQIKPYVLIAKKFAVSLKIIEASGHYQNIHQVPEDVLAHMKKSYENNVIIIANIHQLLADSHDYLQQSKAHFFKSRIPTQ
jgi:predicted kinase